MDEMATTTPSFPPQAVYVFTNFTACFVPFQWYFSTALLAVILAGRRKKSPGAP